MDDLYIVDSCLDRFLIVKVNIIGKGYSYSNSVRFHGGYDLIKMGRYNFYKHHGELWTRVING